MWNGITITSIHPAIPYMNISAPTHEIAARFISTMLNQLTHGSTMLNQLTPRPAHSSESSRNLTKWCSPRSIHEDLDSWGIEHLFIQIVIKAVEESWRIICLMTPHWIHLIPETLRVCSLVCTWSCSPRISQSLGVYEQSLNPRYTHLGMACRDKNNCFHPSLLYTSVLMNPNTPEMCFYFTYLDKLVLSHELSIAFSID